MYCSKFTTLCKTLSFIAFKFYMSSWNNGRRYFRERAVKQISIRPF